MSDSTLIDPVEAFVEAVNLTAAGRWENKLYIMQSVCGSINASIVGMFNQHIIQSERNPEIAADDSAPEAPTDSIAAYIASRSATENNIAGSTPNLDPFETARGYTQLAAEIAHKINLSEDDFKAVCQFNGTLDFMLENRPLHEDQVKAVADMLNLSETEVRAAAQANAREDRLRLSNNAGKIRALYEAEVAEHAGRATDLSLLHPQAQSRFANSLMKIVSKRKARAIRFGLQGNSDALSEASILALAEQQISAWIADQARNDTDFSDAQDRALAS